MAQAVAPSGSIVRGRTSVRGPNGPCGWLALLIPAFLTALVHAGGAAPAPASAFDEPQGYGSPSAVLRHFVQSMRDADMDTAIRCMDLQGVPPAVRDEIGERFALQLALVLERVPPVKLEEVVGEDSVTLMKTEAGDIAFRRRANAAGDRLWQFSARTVDAMPRIFREMAGRPILEPSAASADAGHTHVEPMQWRAPEVALWLSLPHWMKGQALGLELYQWLGLPLVALLGWGLARVLESPIHGLLVRMGGMQIVQLPEWPVILRRCTSAAAWTVALQSSAWLMLLLGLPLALLDPLFLGVQVANLVLVTRLVLQLIDFAGAWLRSHDHARRGLRAMDDLLVASVSRVAKIGVITGAVVWLVSIVGAESSLNRLLAGLGIGGLAFALALQEPLRNFFSSLVLAADRPFSVGDTLAFDGVTGKVEEVGFRTTTLRTRLETRLVVPNATIVSTKLETHAGTALKEFRAVLPIAFHADPAAILAFKTRAVSLVASAPGVREKGQDIGVTALGVNGIEFTVVALFEKSEQAFPEVFDALHMRLLAAAREAGLPLRERPAL